MQLKSKSILTLSLLTLTILLTLTSTTFSIDNDDFELYNESEDSGFEETTLEMSETDSTPAQTPEIPSDPTPVPTPSAPEPTTLDAGTPSTEPTATPSTDPESQKSNSESDFVETSPEPVPQPKPQTQPSAPRPEQAKESQPLPKGAEELLKRKEIRMIVCLAMYSKSASDKYAFHNKLESLFKKAMIEDDRNKQKLVERFIVNAVYECSTRLENVQQEKVQEMMVRLYRDELGLEEVSHHIRYREEIILDNLNEMTAQEVATSQQMKDIQAKHGGAEGQETTRGRSLTEVYGEYLFLIIIIIVVCIMAYMCMSIKNKQKPEQVLMSEINGLKKDRKELMLKEKKLAKEIEDVKGKLNAAKKSK